MNKKLLAVAVAGALAAPVAAFAQSSVTIYGRANAGLDSWKATGSTAGAGGDYNRRTRVYDSGSRLGFRGTEDLGGGMRAYFVMETGVNLDAGTATTQAGAANGSAGTWASRDSFVGLAGSWGEVSWGRQSMFWANGLNAQTGANYINSSADGILTGHNLVAAPVTRQSNVFYYTSPRLAGMWDIAVGYSPTSEAALVGPSVDGTTTATGANIWNLNVKFRTGPWYAQYDHARNSAKATAAAVAGQVRTNTGDKLGVSYGYAPDSRFAVIWQRLKNDNVSAVANTDTGTLAVAGDDIKVSMWVFNLEHAIGPWRLYGEYLKAGSVSGLTGTNTGSTKVSAWTLGAKYHFSKRTGIYGSYNTVRNGTHAWADLNGGGYSSASTGGSPAGLASGNMGADVKVWGLGLMHNF